MYKRWVEAKENVACMNYDIWLKCRNLFRPKAWKCLLSSRYSSFQPAPITNWRQPFVEDDVISELGLSMKCTVFGGVLHPMIKNKPFPSFGYWYGPHFPTTNNFYRRVPGSAVLKKPTLSTTILTFPVPVKVFEGFHNTEFWDAATPRSRSFRLQFSTFVHCRLEQDHTGSWKLNKASYQ